MITLPTSVYPKLNPETSKPSKSGPVPQGLPQPSIASRPGSVTALYSQSDRVCHSPLQPVGQGLSQPSTASRPGSVTALYSQGRPARRFTVRIKHQDLGGEVLIGGIVNGDHLVESHKTRHENRRASHWAREKGVT
ncbi:hypothetical protein RRG08_029365 [Elysia crispata]|uniref:Uncharacterized protein n=1 Tax=Elysia crispata TaxID=231223 RepID=A0AAE1EBZ9_9GAST|nr:hypothetical protein RRG08_029365 [Elysia crispata]